MMQLYIVMAVDVCFTIQDNSKPLVDGFNKRM